MHIHRYLVSSITDRALANVPHLGHSSREKYGTRTLSDTPISLKHITGQVEGSPYAKELAQFVQLYSYDASM